ITLLMPLVLLLLFGFAISTEVRNIRICAVVDRHTDETRAILERFRCNEYFDFQGLVASTEQNRMLEEGLTDAILILRSASGNTESQIIVDASNTTMAQAATGYIESVVSGQSGNSPIISSTLYNPQLKSSYNFVPGIMGMIFILICAIMTSVSIVREKETGTLNLLIVSPIRAYTIILGKLIPYFILSAVILAIVLLLAYGVLGMPYSPASIVNVVLFSLLYILLSLSIGLLISALVRTQMAALIVSAVAFMLPVVMLSGMIFPIDNLPVVLQWVSAVIPARWYIAAMRKIMVQEISIEFLVRELTILASTTAVLLTLAIVKFKSAVR
ncbi:MAG: ABC transporter permease, partial [Paramuribaculum sp.]|nr:ABC transporter permease [Paramuribaculum sp.]